MKTTSLKCPRQSSDWLSHDAKSGRLRQQARLYTIGLRAYKAKSSEWSNGFDGRDARANFVAVAEHWPSSYL